MWAEFTGPLVCVIFLRDQWSFDQLESFRDLMFLKCYYCDLLSQALRSECSCAVWDGFLFLFCSTFVTHGGFCQVVRLSQIRSNVSRYMGRRFWFRLCVFHLWMISMRDISSFLLQQIKIQRLTAHTPKIRKNTWQLKITVFSVVIVILIKLIKN